MSLFDKTISQWRPDLGVRLVWLETNITSVSAEDREILTEGYILVAVDTFAIYIVNHNKQPIKFGG